MLLAFPISFITFIKSITHQQRRISKSTVHKHLKMALITCEDCGKEISEKAPACPNCGAPQAVKEPKEATAQTIAAPKKETASNQTPSKDKSNKNPYLKWIVLIVVILGLTLPFHYVPSRMTMFPKSSLTFSNTIIKERDINDIIDRYNNASFFQKQAINNEPFIRKLMEKGILVEIDQKETIE